MKNEPVPVAQESFGAMGVVRIIEGIQEIQKGLMLEHARLANEAQAAELSANIVRQQIEVLQSVLDAPFAQPGQREDQS